MARRGFTLMEAAVTLAIAMIVIFAAVNLQVLLTRSYTSSRRIAGLADRIMSLSSYMAKELITAGGNAAGTASSIWIENNCVARGQYPDCPNGSDRITLFSAISKLPACRISHVDATVDPPRVAFWYRDAARQPHCCFNDEKTGVREGFAAPNQYLKQHAMLVQGAYHKAVLLIGDASAPGFTTTPAPAGYVDDDTDDDGIVDTRCTFRVVDVMPPAERYQPANPADWRDGTATIVDMRTLYVDARLDPPTLMLHTDLDDNGEGLAPTLTDHGTPNGDWMWADMVFPPLEETLQVMDGVYDFQVMLGYDLDADGVVEPLEWVHDTPGEIRDPNQDRRLRMLRLDAVLGVKVGGLYSTLAAPTPARDGGNTILLPGIALRPMSVEVMPRNTDSLIAGVD